MKSLTKTICKSLVALVIASLSLSSCISDKKIMLFQSKSDQEASKEFLGKLAEPYRLKPGDHLYIKIYSIDPKTSKFFQTDFPQFMSSTYLYLNSYKVDEEGYLSFLFIDKMFVKGMTVNEVQDMIQSSLDQYFKESTAFVKLVNFQITILGEIGSPGTFEIQKEDISMYEAIGRAGGFTDYSNVKQVKLIRQTAGGSKIYQLDLTSINFLESQYLHLQPNDVIYVDPRKSKRFVFTKFPYGFAFGLTGTVLGLYTIVKDTFL